MSQHSLDQLRLEVYAAAPITLDRSRIYTQAVDHKPEGLWVSVAGEDDWPTWCRGEEFSFDNLTVCHRVTLVPGANILHLKSPMDIDAFHYLYANRGILDWIDWGKVAADYDGIIIAPYQWSRRMDPHWYYTWDCASGCIWNLEAIESVEAE
ncbi:hypothetical protein SEA_DALLAS_199 [Mycobacterium phage Dallas]|nr:hypothetical protein SEA_NIHILNOMEN_202 [Mycobacterium phage NihilNomen]QDP43942.1 hypothetical protein SEA_DALLAS_199 [Mycobacterium phage Dallas]